MIDAFASQLHLQDHVLAVWGALPPEGRRGTIWCPSRRLLARAEDAGYAAEARRGLPDGARPTLVANYVDMVDVPIATPIVYLQHGAGQTYVGLERDESYAGGRYRGRVGLFLEPNERTAARERIAYPDAAVRVVGSPYLDELVAGLGIEPSAPEDMSLGHAPAFSPPTGEHTVVAFAWHFDLHLLPETRWAFDHYRPALRDLARRDDLVVLGHGHPRAFDRLRPHYATAGIEQVESFAEICARADVLAVDNTSAGPLFAAATGRPLVWLNAPWYRRDVEHGGRFWDWPRGQVSCGDPEMLVEAIHAAAVDSDDARCARARMVAECWAPSTRGIAGKLAAEAITEVYG